MKTILKYILQVFLTLLIIFFAIMIWHITRTMIHGYDTPEKAAKKLFKAWSGHDIYGIGMCLDKDMRDYSDTMRNIDKQLENDESDTRDCKITTDTKYTTSYETIRNAKETTGINNIKATADVNLITDRPVKINGISYDFSSVSEIQLYQKNDKWFVMSFSINDEKPAGRTDRSKDMKTISENKLGTMQVPSDYTEKTITRDMIKDGYLIESPDETVKITIMEMPDSITKKETIEYIYNTLLQNGIQYVTAEGTTKNGTDYTEIMTTDATESCQIEMVFDTKPARCIELTCPLMDANWHRDNCLMTYKP